MVTRSGWSVAVFTVTLLACGAESTPNPANDSSDASDGSATFPDPACVGLDDLSDGTGCTADSSVCRFDVPGYLCHPGQQVTSPYASIGTCACTSSKWSCTYAANGPRGFGLVPCPGASAPDAGK